jgi:hypothetical protein
LLFGSIFSFLFSIVLLFRLLEFLANIVLKAILWPLRRARRQRSEPKASDPSHPHSTHKAEGQARDVSLMYWAAENGISAIARELLSANPEIALNKDDNGMTPLHIATQNGHEAVVQVLLAAHPEGVQERNKYGKTPLCIAVEKGHESVARMLVDDYAGDAGIRAVDRYWLPHLAENQLNPAFADYLRSSLKPSLATKIMFGVLLGWAAPIRWLLLRARKRRAEAATSKSTKSP